MAFYTQKITGNTKTEVTTPYNVYDSMVLTNVDDSAAVSVDLYVADQSGTYITDSGINSAEVGDVEEVIITTTASGSTAVHTDLFNEEKVWKSDKTLFGNCTSVTNATTINFSAGLENAMTDAVDLYTGTRFYLLKNVAIPAGASLKLEPDEIYFDNNYYKLYIVSGDADGQIDIILRYNTKRR